MRIIDAQFHCWESESAQWPWDPEFGKPGTPMAASRAHYAHAPFPATALLATMDEVGVDAGIFVLPSIYGTDNRYALAVAATSPRRLAAIGKIDERVPGFAERLQTWRDQPGMLGVRIIVGKKERHRLESAEMIRLLSAAAKHAVPVCLYPYGCLPDVIGIADRHPQLQIVIDHLGLAAPPPIPAEGDAFADLPLLIELARRPNVAIKVSGVPALSSQKYPFADLWPHLHRILDAYGLDRTMWGSDFTRVAELHTYREALDYIRKSSELSETDKEKLFGTTLPKVFRWRLDQ